MRAMADEVGVGVIGTMPIGGSGSGALPGTFNLTSAEAPDPASINSSGPLISQVDR